MRKSLDEIVGGMSVTSFPDMFVTVIVCGSLSVCHGWGPNDSSGGRTNRSGPFPPVTDWPCTSFEPEGVVWFIADSASASCLVTFCWSALAPELATTVVVSWLVQGLANWSRCDLSLGNDDDSMVVLVALFSFACGPDRKDATGQAPSV